LTEHCGAWFYDNVTIYAGDVECLTTDGAARLLGIGRNRVRILARNGRLTALGPYLTKESVLQYAQERKR
jgi:hypothetical protein